MIVDKYYGLIEAVLFYENEVVSVDKLTKLTGLDSDKVEEILMAIKNSYDENNVHGITLAEIAGGYVFQIKKDISLDFKQIYNVRERGKLSRSAMTVLSIIAYKQPITKSEVEDIRGVACDNSIRILLEKNLISICGRKDALGRPLLYGTTDDFLKSFNLKSLADLPTINELKSDEFNG